MNKKESTQYIDKDSRADKQYGGRPVIDIIKELRAENEALKKKVEECQESERKFYVLTESAPVGIFSTDHTGNTTYVNPHWCNISGMSYNEALGDGWIRAVHPDDLDQLIAGWEKAVADKRSSYAEYRFLRKDGTVVWVIGNSVPQFNGDGEIVNYIGTITDITERKIAGEKIRTLSRVAEQNPSSILITDSYGSIAWVNSRFTDLMQYTLDDVRGRPPRIFNRGHIPQEEYEEMWSTLRSGRTWSGETRNRKKDGRFFQEKVIISPLLDESGNLTNYIIISEDITGRKKMVQDLVVAKEKAEESDRLKTSFLNNLSHEIRTPLNAITGFSALLSEPGLPAERKVEFTGIIMESSDQLLTVLNDIISISAIETGQVEVIEMKTDVEDLFVSIYRKFASKAGESDNCLKYCIDGMEGDHEILTDSNKLMQILSNLVNNAVKFTGNGEVKYGCSLSDDSLYFYVSDTGIGIPSGMHQEIFKPFRQLETANNRKYGGPGLGLSIAGAYVKLLGGRIWLESEPGAGSTFYFTLPFKKP